MKNHKNILLLHIFLFINFLPFAQKEQEVELLIIGGGASGTTAGVQAARLGVKTMIIEESNWLGGMLTSAGVSAVDGNHQLPSGLWGEFRQKLYNHYGGPEKLSTGWVSHTLFEPSIGNKMFKELAKEENLTIWYKSKWKKIVKKEDLWEVTVKKKGKNRTIKAKLLIDATELGDVLANVGVDYNIGMNSKHDTNESMAPEKANNIVQDMTYVIILKDYGKGKNMTIRKPNNYNPNDFKCSIDVSDPAGDGKADHNAEMMITYGKLPNDKYMINWPKCGNDVYLNIIEMSPNEREKELKKAKERTLEFIYYIQTELGYSNLGIAKDEFPTRDDFPMIPYHRESRLIEGVAKLNVNHMSSPFNQKEAYYRTGIAVGDYPIDHHHLERPDAPKIDFINIKIPSYNVPLGSLIPKKVDGLIVAEKSISVTNIVNGATRLQPVVLGIGQSAGALAAAAIKNKTEPRNVSIREVQQLLLNSKAYIMPYIDVKPNSKYFESIQKIGATGIMKGVGVPYKWANETWFYPDRDISEYEFVSGLESYYKINRHEIHASGKSLTLKFLMQVFHHINKDITTDIVEKKWKSFNFSHKDSTETFIDRGKTALMIDALLNPFGLEVDFNGKIK